MRGVIKIPIPSPPPPIPPTPTFDYIIDIYADKIVVTDASNGTATTLGTVNDLNNWLRNVRGKKIKINVNTVVTSDLVLTQNEYWIFGEWIKANVYILEPNTTIISFAPLGNEAEGYYVNNTSPDTGNFVDVSGLKLFAVYADVDIETWGSFTINNINVYILSSAHTRLGCVNGDVYIVAANVDIIDSKLRNAYIYAHINLWMDSVQGIDSGTWCIMAPNGALINNIILDNAGRVFMHLKKILTATLSAYAIQSFDLMKVTDTKNRRFLMYTVEAFGLWSSATVGNLNYFTITPSPPPDVTYSIDLNTQTVTITNNTASTQNIVLVYELIVS